jgi:diguanylate cyclase (GGDEF)-like protein
VQDQETEAARQLLGAIASLAEVKQQDTAACNARLAAFVKEYPDYKFLGVVDRQGVRFCSSGISFPAGRVSMAGFPFYKLAVRTGKFVVGDYRLSIVGKVPVLEFGSPYFDDKGSLAGVVYGGLNLDHMIAQLARQPLPPGARVIVADRTGTVIASLPQRRWIGKRLPRAQLARLGADKIGTADLPGLGGHERIYGYVPVAASPGEGIYVAYGLDKDAALADVRKAVGRGLAAAAGVLAAALLAFWYGRRYIRRPVTLLLDVCEEWRQGDWTVRAPTGGVKGEFEQIAHGFNQMAQTVQDELARRAQAEASLAHSHAEILQASHRLAARADIVRYLATMGQRLQSCTTDEEMADAISRFAPQILPGVSGALCVLSNSRNLVRVVATWNAPAGLEADFTPRDCWALRRGQAHIVQDVAHEVVCAHVNPEKVTGYGCRPLIAQGETIGLLYLETALPSAEAGEAAAVSLNDFDALAENISLALGNQKLREKLRDQSIRDPLTGLFNRRYLEEALELDLARAVRNGLPVSLIMGDVDHFKQFNDRFGHDAGDLVLKRTAEVMRVRIRKGDLACRYGGEEFLMLLHGAGLAEARERAETIREAIKLMEVSFRGQALGQVTISLGIATYPEHATDGEALITAADAAMYAAKHSGRDRVHLATSNPRRSERIAADPLPAGSAVT